MTTPQKCLEGENFKCFHKFQYETDILKQHVVIAEAVSNLGRVLRMTKRDGHITYCFMTGGRAGSNGHIWFEHWETKQINNRKKVCDFVAKYFLEGYDETIHDIEHIDGNRSNNNVENLKTILKGSKKTGSKNTSVYIGVYFDKTKKKWKASITHQGKKINLGSFDTELEAVEEYNDKCCELGRPIVNVI